MAARVQRPSTQVEIPGNGMPVKHFGERLNDVRVMLAHERDEDVFEMIGFLRHAKGARIASQQSHGIRLHVQNGRRAIHQVVTRGSDEDAAGGV